MGSAICSYDIKDIIKAFKGRFKEQATSSSAWLPVLSNKVPEPRPGECVNNTETLPGGIKKKSKLCKLGYNKLKIYNGNFP